MRRATLALAAVALAGCGEANTVSFERFDVESRLIGRSLEHVHDRADGNWGSYVVQEVIPAAVRRLAADGTRVAIGGISMGGFGALDLVRLHPERFCAVGGHSPALWRTGGETPAGAFDDGKDFARHDLFADPLGAGQRVWLDVGRTTRSATPLSPTRRSSAATAPKSPSGSGRAATSTRTGGGTCGSTWRSTPTRSKAAGASPSAA